MWSLDLLCSPTQPPRSFAKICETIFCESFFSVAIILTEMPTDKTKCCIFWFAIFKPSIIRVPFIVKSITIRICRKLFQCWSNWFEWFIERNLRWSWISFNCRRKKARNDWCILLLRFEDVRWWYTMIQLLNIRNKRSEDLHFCPEYFASFFFKK